MRRQALIDLLALRYPDRERRVLYAQVLRGEVTVDGVPVLKPGTRVRDDAAVAARTLPRFVSRGGEKLAAAINAWGTPCAGTTWVDAGCSTGGFTDCLLQNGAALVYAVDVGEGQLHWRLRGDRRVVVRERTNIMDLAAADFSPAPARVAADLSFRSLRRAARHILGLTVEGRGIFLVKPQFEFTDAPEDFRGVVRGADALRGILEELQRDLAFEGVTMERAMASPIHGRKGNREYLCELRCGGPSAAPCVLEEELFLE